MRILNERLLRHLIGEVRVDVSDVSLAAQLGDIRRSNLSHQQLVPINGLKEGVLHDLVDIEPVVRISG